MTPNSPAPLPRPPFLCRRPFLWALVGVGAALRVFQYVSDTSLWFDELSLVRNLVHRSASQLLREPLEYHQVAPVGFMVAEKGISHVLGTSDLAFRFLLLPIGLAALVLFVRLAERLLEGYAVPFAVAAFAIGGPFIRYSAEIKQYGIDVAAMLALSLIALRLRDADATWTRCALAGCAGAILVWFSQGTVFVVAGLGAALLLAWLRDRDAQTRRAILVAVPIWAAAAAAATLVSLRHMSPATKAFMEQFWRYRGGFFPWPLRKPGDALWLWDRVTQLFGDGMVLRYPWPAVYSILAIAGMIVLWRRNRFGALVLLGPFAVTALAAVAQQYPFRTRLVLFLLPALLLAVAQAAEWIRQRAARLHPAVGGVLMAALFFAPARAFLETPPPYRIEDHKSVLAFFREYRKPGAAEYGLGPNDYQLGGCWRDDRRAYLRDVDRYRGLSRVWLIAGGVPPFHQARSSIESYLAAIGVRREGITIPSEKPLDPVSADLFDLSDPARLAAASADTFPLPPPGDLLPVCGEWVLPVR
ncbi:MAG: hypothetical protein ABI968_11785 [Acidobacteriota bacterium]